MIKKKNKKPSKAEEPGAAYRKIEIFSSFEEQEERQRAYYLSLSGEERLELMRKYINMAYKMYGYVENYRPAKRSIKIHS